MIADPALANSFIAAIERSRRIEHSALRHSLETLARESFFPPGPWWKFVFDPRPPYFQYVRTRDAEVEHLYDDVAFGLSVNHKLNTGLPSVVIGWIDRLAPEPGETVVQIGTGLGYYTALLSNLVGCRGRVTTYETNHNLLQTARRNLAPYHNVNAVHADGLASGDKGDVVLSHVGGSLPPMQLARNLPLGGRMVFTLSTTTNSISEVGIGMTYLARKVSPDILSAEFLGFPFITTASGGRRKEEEERIDRALERGGWDDVRSLRLGPSLDDSRSWLGGDGWCLSARPPDT